MSAPEPLRRAAARLRGLSLGEYDDRVVAGLKWCCGCRRWQPLAEFYRSGGMCKKADNRARRCREEAQWEEFRNWLLARVLVK